MAAALALIGVVGAYRGAQRVTYLTQGWLYPPSQPTLTLALGADHHLFQVWAWVPDRDRITQEEAATIVGGIQVTGSSRGRVSVYPSKSSDEVVRNRVHIASVSADPDSGTITCTLQSQYQGSSRIGVGIEGGFPPLAYELAMQRDLPGAILIFGLLAVIGLAVGGLILLVWGIRANGTRAAAAG